ncbi:4'-phosphopantetheinyl transferase family protein [Roseobacter cerasinus]|uniref:4'-phosphopantetheinyl transferase family protein n=1 Tax=Roseobacter cerasinus TaxID=2602289 RepID=UPI001EEACB48|nr:4'-phosphopantetheinyl transferase superfamily protein [Roseobacter cerasinus]
MRLNTTPSGKPCLPDAPQLGYSISHCHGWGLLGLAVETEIGVDLERVTSRRVRLAELILSEEERLAWATCPENTRAEWITRAWVRKEALLKATGTGLGTRLTDINVMSAAGMQERMVDLTGPPTYVGAAHLLRSARAAELHIHTPQLSMAA